MNFNHVTTTRQLAAARTGFTLTDAAGVQVTCHEGCLWLTLDNDPRDIILAAGESYETDAHRPMFVYALEASAFDMIPSRVATPSANTSLTTSAVNIGKALLARIAHWGHAGGAHAGGLQQRMG